MTASFRFSLTFAILSSLAGLLVLTWVLFSLISFKTAENDLFSQKNEEGRVLLASFISILPSPLTDPGTGSAAAGFAGKLAQEHDFAGLLVVDAKGGKVFARSDDRGADTKLLETLKKGTESHSFSGNGRFVSRYAPIFDAGRIAGASRLSLSLGSEFEKLARSRRMFLAYFILDFLLLFGLGSFLLSRIVVVPIRKLLAATERIAAGDYGQTVHVPGSADVAELAEAFNKMVTALQAKREEVESHVKSLETANADLHAAREETIRSEKMASVGLLAAGMAHEVGTPLAAIMGYAGILREELHEDPVRGDYLRRIEDESCRIDRIVRGLLDYARPSKAECENVDIGVLLKDTLDLLAGQGAFKRVETILSPEDGLPPVYADRHQLQQVLINLLINARDAMPDGGRLGMKASAGELEIPPVRFPALPNGRVMGRRKEDFHGVFRASFPDGDASRWVKIEISDSGVGIAAENLGNIFDPFFTTKEPGKGTGLGLAICARIVDSFGGRIIAESEAGKGTTFVVLLPTAVGRGAGGGT
ncbi:MAG: integral membrane sensor signal transduction histidine [Geobacteraceae bacterium]|nr:MAG: integral membrane sensor signal transduction histidine [Geobacteraceae bacterium]